MLDYIQYDQIHHYKNLLPSAEMLIDLIEDTELIINDNTPMTKWKLFSTKPHENDAEPYTFQTYEYVKTKVFKKDITKDKSKLVYSIYKKLLEPVEKAVGHYASTYGLKVANFTDFSINKAYPGKHTGPHVDSHGLENSPKLTTILFLNNKFDGGEMLFRHQKVMIDPVPGSVLVYPSMEPYYHQPNQIKNGVKYTASMYWYTNDKSN